MYESPIKVYETQIEMAKENEIFKAIKKIGVTVNKDELIKALEYDRGQYNKGFEDEKETACKWISVKDRLPEDRGNVLAWSPRYNEVVIAWYHEEEDFWRTDDNFAPFPTHWMPLPEPPKGE